MSAYKIHFIASELAEEAEAEGNFHPEDDYCQGDLQMHEVSEYDSNADTAEQGLFSHLGRCDDE